MPIKADLRGRRFCKVTVLYEDGRSKHGKVLWKCRCDCGKEFTTTSSYLLNGDTKSCGCLKHERTLKHGLNVTHERLCKSIQSHFKALRDKKHGYQFWSLDPRYSDNAEGVVNFCNDIIALQPEMCAQYETNHELELDKDNGGNVFCPECIKFIPSSENRSKHYNNHIIPGGSSLSAFVRKTGTETRKNGKKTKEYCKYEAYFRNHNHEVHPELIKRANELIALFTKCLNLLKLRDDVRRFASDAGIPLRSTQQ